MRNSSSTRGVMIRWKVGAALVVGELTVGLCHHRGAQVLPGVRVLFSRVFPLGAAQQTQQLWRMAEDFGAACTTDADEAVTHVVANCRGTEKAQWALRSGKHVVAPAWCAQHTQQICRVFSPSPGVAAAGGSYGIGEGVSPTECRFPAVLNPKLLPPGDGDPWRRRTTPPPANPPPECTLQSAFLDASLPFRNQESSHDMWVLLVHKLEWSSSGCSLIVKSFISQPLTTMLL